MTVRPWRPRRCTWRKALERMGMPSQLSDRLGFSVRCNSELVNAMALICALGDEAEKQNNEFLSKLSAAIGEVLLWVCGEENQFGRLVDRFIEKGNFPSGVE